MSETGKKRAATFRQKPSGAVLFEVVLALGLFVFAAAVITSSFSTSVQNMEQMRTELDASNLAISIFSGMEMGLHPIETTEPLLFEPPFEQWTWQAEVVNPEEDPALGTGLIRVEIIVNNQDLGFERRLTQLLTAMTTSSQP